MAEITRMTPKSGLAAKEWLENFIREYGDEIDGVIIVAMHKDGEIIDGWSKEVPPNAMTWLGALEQLKLDFWYTLFEKRTTILNLEP